MIEPLTLNPENIEKEIDFIDLEKHRIRPSDKLPPPESALEMTDEDTGKTSIIATKGNVTAIIGKAKAKKTFYTSIVIAALISENPILRTYHGRLPLHQCNGLVFDTEQSKWHVHKVVKRICTIAGIADPDNLIVYALRSEETKTRLAFIEKKIYETENLGFVVIDGIRDLVFDINSPEEATEIAGKLLKWSEELNIVIITVLHQNKGDGNARGHLGTELINKSETVLAVEKKDNSDISVVIPQFCRNREPDLFAFEVDENGIPFKVRVPQDRENKPKFSIDEVQLSVIWELVQTVFTEIQSGAPMTDGILRVQIKSASKGFFPEKEILNDAEVNKVLLIAKANQMIIQEKKRYPFKLGNFPL